MKEKLCRASVDRKLLGVCGGLAHYFGIDSTLIRLAVAVLTFFAGITIPIYLIAALIMPQCSEY